MKDVIDVVIPIKDKNDKITRTCLEHLEKTQRYPFNPILIEDRGESFRFGKSMNRGISESDSDIIIGMDSDSFPSENAFKDLVDFMEKYPDLGYSGVRVRQKEGIGLIETLGWTYGNCTISSIKIGILSLAPIYTFKKLVKKKIIYDIIGVNEFVPGMTGQATCLFAIRKKCWEDVGGFDEQFRTSYSDVDLCYRIILSDKWKVSSCPWVSTYHIGHQTRKKEYTKLYNLIGDREKYDKKWPHEKILEVVEASKRGKFLIPDEFFRVKE